MYYYCLCSGLSKQRKVFDNFSTYFPLVFLLLLLLLLLEHDTIKLFLLVSFRNKEKFFPLAFCKNYAISWIWTCWEIHGRHQINLINVSFKKVWDLREIEPCDRTILERYSLKKFYLIFDKVAFKTNFLIKCPIPLFDNVVLNIVTLSHETL